MTFQSDAWNRCIKNLNNTIIENFKCFTNATDKFLFFTLLAAVYEENKTNTCNSFRPKIGNYNFTAVMVEKKDMQHYTVH